MRVAVIGAGNVGGAFAAAAVRAGHEVVITALHPERAEAAARASGGSAAASSADAVRGADVVLLAIPAAAKAEWASSLADQLAGAVVIDATNPLNETFSDVDPASSAASLQTALPDTRIVKAFNTVFASRLGAPSQDGQPLDVLIAGDDDAAKTVVAQLAQSLQFNPRDAGRLRMARAMEEMAFLNISLNAANGWMWQSAWQLVGPTVPA